MNLDHIKRIIDHNYELVDRSNKLVEQLNNLIKFLSKSFDAIYLEDNTPVRTIKVTNFPKNTTSEYLQGFFEHASGPIANVSLLRECEEMVAYITFTVPEDAAKLICDTTLKMKFTVKQAKNDHQPKIDPNSPRLEQINDNCLLHIISHLDLVDVVTLGNTCSRLNAVTKLTYGKFRHLSFGAYTGDSSLNESNLPRILPDIGSYTKSLDIYNLNANILKAFSTTCPNVNTMKIINPSKTLTSTAIKKCKMFFANVESLEIQGCGFFDISMNLICSKSKLKSLILVQCLNMKGKFLLKLKKLKVLKVTGSCGLQQENHAVFNSQKNNQLTAFATDVCGCSYKHFLQNIENVQDMQELTLDFSRFNGDILELANLNHLTQLTKLVVTRYLYPNNSFPNLNKFLVKLAEIKTLESLEIEYIEIGTETLQHLKEIKNLICLNLGIMNNPIGNAFYKAVHQHLSKLRELVIRVPNNNSVNNPKEYESISKMITNLRDLDYFSYSAITIPLLQIILKDIQQSRTCRQSTIKIAISKLIADDQQKKEFIAASKGSVILIK